MSADFDHLEKVLNTKRCPTQKAVIRELLRGRMTARAIARALGVTENAVNIALSELKAHGVVEVPIRGRFYIREELIALALLDRVRSLEERLIRKGVTLDRRPRPHLGKGVSPSEASGSEPTTVDKEAG